MLHAARRHYGTGAFQYGDLHVSQKDPERGTIVLFHGGFWRARRELSMTTPFAQSLADVGWNVWNVEYRRIGQGTWQETLRDCRSALAHVDVLGAELGIDTRSLLVVGHSAGGQLAAWASTDAKREGRQVTGLVTLNGVLALSDAAAREVGNGAVTEFLGGLPSTRQGAYAVADPIARLPIGIPTRCLHSKEDERVPFDLSETFVLGGKQRGDDINLHEVAGHHTAPIEIGTAAWTAALIAIESLRVGVAPLPSPSEHATRTDRRSA